MCRCGKTVVSRWCEYCSASTGERVTAVQVRRTIHRPYQRAVASSAHLYRCDVELLERDEALATLAEARATLRRAATGRVVLVTGEPGIGKTSLVARFLRGPRSRARGCCSAPATTSRSRGRSARSAISSAASRPRSRRRSRAGAAPHEIQTPADRASSSSRRARRCSCSRTCTGRTTRRSTRSPCSGGASARCRRCSSSPSAAARRRPGIRCTRPSARSAPTTRVISSSRRCRSGGRVAGRRATPTTSTRATGGNPFYVTELLASRVGRRAAAVDRERGPRSCVAARRRRAPPARARLRRAGPHAHVAARRGDAGLGRGRGRAGAPAAARGRAGATSASGTSWRATRSGRACRSPRAGACTPRSSTALLATDADPADIVHHAEAAGAEDVVADYALVAARRAAALESNREAYSHYRRAVGLRRPARRCPSRRRCSRSSRSAAYVVGRLDEAFAGDRAGDRDLPRARRRGGRRPLHARAVAAPLVRRRRRRRAREGARGDRDPRAARRVGRARARLQRPLAARDARRGHRRGARVGRASARARRRGSATTARARTRSSTSARRRIQLDHARAGDAARGARGRRRGGRPARGDARARQPRLLADVLGAAGAGAALRASRRSPTRERARGAHARVATSPRCIAWLRLRAGEWDEAERAVRDEIERGQHRAPAAREDGAGRARGASRRCRRGRAAGRSRAPRPSGPASCSGSRRCSSSRPSGR